MPLYVDRQTASTTYAPRHICFGDFAFWCDTGVMDKIAEVLADSMPDLGAQAVHAPART
jgi:hypothetical protein